MAETKPTASAPKSNATVQTKKSSNIISILAPVLCIIGGYLIWRFILGADAGFGQSTKDQKVHGIVCMKVVSSFRC